MGLRPKPRKLLKKFDQNFQVFSESPAPTGDSKERLAPRQGISMGTMEISRTLS
jgi:hypothetical protein